MASQPVDASVSAMEPEEIVLDETGKESSRNETGPAPAVSAEQGEETNGRPKSPPRLVIPEPAASDVVGPGPSTDLATPMFASHPALVTTGPAIIINLLLTSSGTRHPYKIDEKYLDKRGVKAQGTGDSFDPFVITVYTLKELIWRDWRSGEAQMTEMGGRTARLTFDCRMGNTTIITGIHSTHSLWTLTRRRLGTARLPLQRLGSQRGPPERQTAEHRRRRRAKRQAERRSGQDEYDARRSAARERCRMSMCHLVGKRRRHPYCCRVHRVGLVPGIECIYVCEGRSWRKGENSVMHSVFYQFMPMRASISECRSGLFRSSRPV